MHLKISSETCKMHNQKSGSQTRICPVINFKILELVNIAQIGSDIVIKKNFWLLKKTLNIFFNKTGNGKLVSTICRGARKLTHTINWHVRSTFDYRNIVRKKKSGSQVRNKTFHKFWENFPNLTESVKTSFNTFAEKVLTKNKNVWRKSNVSSFNDYIQRTSMVPNEPP